MSAPCAARHIAALVAALIIGTVTAAQSARAVLLDSAALGSNALSADVLDPPTGLAASGVGLVAIDLTWNATPDAYASGYYVLRATAADGPYAQIAVVTPAAMTTYSDNPAVGTYYYRVRAFVRMWESADSNTVSCTAILLAFVCS